METELFEILAEQDIKKYVIGLVVLVVMPMLTATVLSYLKNKTSKNLIKVIETNTIENNNNIKTLCEKVDNLYSSKFIEATSEQVDFVIKHRFQHDVAALVKSTKRIITLNHIYEDTDETKGRIRKIVTNLYNKSKNEMACFEYKSIKLGEHFKTNWIIDNATVIEQFIYNERIDGKNGYTYNYDVLKSRLSSNYDTISNEFFESINAK